MTDESRKVMLVFPYCNALSVDWESEEAMQIITFRVGMVGNPHKSLYICVFGCVIPFLFSQSINVFPCVSLNTTILKFLKYNR